MRFVEVAVGVPSKRGHLLTLKQYQDATNKPDSFKEKGRETIYRSTYLYGKDAKEYFDKNRTLKNFFGKRYIDLVPIDIDKGDNTDEYTLSQVKACRYDLVKEYDLQPGNYNIFFSGTGYHIIISADCFDFPQGDKELPYIVKETMKRMFEHIDLSVYSRTAIYRETHSLNLKTGLRKIYLPDDKIGKLDAEQVLDKAKTFSKEPPALWGEGALKGFAKEDVPDVVTLTRVSEPKNIVPCVQEMYNDGPLEGNRNNTILRMASHFRRNGIPSEATKAALLHWNNNQLEKNIIIEKVEATYNGGYAYSCHDKIMMEHCKPRCVYYKRKDYIVDVLGSEDLQKDLESRMTTDYHGRSIDMGKIFGFDEIDCSLYPGELMTIFGPTGSNKTALAQNLALGYSASENMIRKEWQIPTLYLSLELSGWLMHRRNLQIVADQNKQRVNKNFKALFQHYQDELQHIKVQTVSPTLEQIQDKIRELQPALVIVDYIDLVETPPNVRGEYEQIKYISHRLSNMAVNMDLAVIQVSQVNRDYSKSQVMDLYAGKGSGAIENASRKVLGITGKADSPAKKIEMYKNSDGDLFSVNLEWTPSFRLRRADVD